jgi:NADH:ubiquinone oxidoreductase subunit 4 (subunit M)
MRVGHGFVSANMFFLLSMVYKETGRRKLLVINRRSINLGLFMFIFGLALVLKSSAPLSIKFFGELFLFMSIIPSFSVWGFIGIFLANVIGGLLSIFLYLVFFHGSVSVNVFFINLKDYQLGFFMRLFCLFSMIFLFQIVCK